MFGLFKNKKYEFNCSMCGRSYTIKFDPSQITEFDYQYWGGAGYVGQQACEFCKTEMTIALSKHEKLQAFNEKWEKVQKEHDDKLEVIDDEISEIEDQLEDNQDNVKLKKKLKQLESKKEKLEYLFEKKEEKYYDRQSRWEEKWQDKLERM